MNKPTDAQIKEVLEWCGLEIVDNIWVEDHYEPDGQWYDECGHLYEGDYLYGIPSIDPNNLIKYAVPLVVKKLESRFDEATNRVRGLELLFAKWIKKIREGYSIGDALFWAIYEVFQDAEDKKNQYYRDEALFSDMPVDGDK